MDSNISPGEVGGTFAGVVALLMALGKGLQWLLDWKGAREKSQGARLRAWEASLDKREREHREETEHRFRAMEKKVAAVSAALFETIAELQLIEAGAPALTRARLILQQAYPVPTDMPDDIAALVNRLGIQMGASRR